MSKKDLISKLSEKQIDELLTYTPDFSKESLANIKTRSMEKINFTEESDLKKTVIKRPMRFIAAAAIALILLAATVFAAMQLLTAGEVADRLGNTTLSAAFESESAININETITSGDYIFTLLAVVSGEDITDHPIYDRTGEIQSDRTYAILAIQNVDGSPMTLPSEAEYVPFMISPFIRGQQIWQVNAFALGGGSLTSVIDGIKYIIFDFTNITMFADRGIYLAANSGGFSMSALMDAFDFNEQTGEITVNPNFDGANVIFEIPFDISLADPMRAQRFLDDLMSPSDEVGGETPDWWSTTDWDSAVPIESTIQVLSPNADGFVEFSFDVEEFDVKGSGLTSIDGLFEDNGLPQSVIIGGGEAGGEYGHFIYAIRISIDANGVITGKIVVPE